jgi:hypothetical protein
MTSLMVVFDDGHRVLTPAQSMTFGRQADLVVDSTNRSLHRVLGEFRHDASTWRVVNRGRTTSLIVCDLDGASFARVTPGADVPLPFTNAAVMFSAGQANYRLTTHLPLADTEERGRPRFEGANEAELTITLSTVMFNDEQHQLLVALASERAAESDRATTNRQLAKQLGWSINKFNRKLDNLCLKLHRAGVSGLVGDTADVARERRARLAVVAVEYDLVNRIPGTADVKSSTSSVDSPPGVAQPPNA